MSNVEYRLMIERPGVHPPHAFDYPATRELAELQLRQERKHYATWEPSVRLWMESRPVGEWVRWG